MAPPRAVCEFLEPPLIEFLALSVGHLGSLSTIVVGPGVADHAVGVCMV